MINQLPLRYELPKDQDYFLTLGKSDLVLNL